MSNWLVTGACTIFNSAMHENRPVVFAGAGFEKQAHLLDYTVDSDTWIKSKREFRLIETMNR